MRFSAPGIGGVSEAASDGCFRGSWVGGAMGFCCCSGTRAAMPPATAADNNPPKKLRLFFTEPFPQTVRRADSRSPCHQCYTRPSTIPMSSLLSHLPDFTVAHFLRLVGIFVVALVLNRLLRVITNVLIKPAASEARAAKAREQQTRT